MKNDSFPALLADLISSRLSPVRERLYGFEYEFMPGRVLTGIDLENIHALLEELGYIRGPGLFRGTNHYITFEPGGQIEYCSDPVPASDLETVRSIVARALSVNAAMKQRLNIEYIPIGYIPGRGDAPLLLREPRYENLHTLLAGTGSRGHEMMKGTAAIHLHVGLLSLDELPGLWNTVCQMSRTPDFAMGPDRRDIWDNTDPSRCGLLCGREDVPSNDPMRFLEKMTRFGMGALDLAAGVPFHQLPHPDFSLFQQHLTTLFTDVRINMKGITLELRTLDSLPPALFLERWRRFLDLMEDSLERAPEETG